MLLFLQWAFWDQWRMADSTQWIQNILGFGALSVLFGGLTFWGVRQSLTRQPYLVIDSDGLRLPTLGIPRLPWQQIREIRQRGDLFGNAYLDLHLHPSS